MTYSKTESHLTAEGIPTAKLAFIPNGVDTSLFSPQRKRERDTKFLHLLFVGRFSPEKNVTNLARGISEARSKDNIVLTMVGNGTLRDEVEKILKANSVSYHFIHHMPHTSLPTLYQNADIFLLPSKAEGMPKVLLEAMSTGLPVIVGSYPGHESITKDGYNSLVCGHSPHEIGKAIDTLAENTALRARMGQNGRAHILQHYDLPQLVKKEIKLLHHVASQNR